MTVKLHEDLGLIGHGPHAVVSKAEDIDTRATIARKELLPEVRADPELLRTHVIAWKRRMERPRRGLLEVHAYDPGGSAVMELGLHGSAADVVYHGRTTTSVARRATVHFLTALDDLHTDGLVHANIKPTNAFPTGDGEWKLGDARLIRPDGGDTLPPPDAGALPFTPPELLTGARAITPQADVYAVGVLVKAMLAGPAYFDSLAGGSKDPDRLLERLTSDQPSPPIGELVPHLDPAFAALLDEMTRPGPEQRVSVAEALPRAKALLRKAKVAAPWRARRRLLAALGAGALLLVGCAVVALACRGPGGDADGGTAAASAEEPAPRVPVTVADAERPRLPAQLADLEPRIGPVEVAPELRRRLRLWWRLSPPGREGEGREGTLPLDDPPGLALAAAVSAAVPEMGLPLVLTLGVAAEGDGRSGRLRLPRPEDCARVRVGFRLPPGLEHAAPPDGRDAEGNAYAVLRRSIDGMTVSLIPDRGGSGYTLIDRGQVEVQTYVTRFLPEARPYLERAASQLAAFIPEEIATYEALERFPTRGTEPVAPRTPARVAELLAAGPLLYSRREPQWACYPSVPLQDRFPVVLNLAALPGRTTARLPATGLSYCEALAMLLWLRDKTGAPWELTTPAREAAVAGSADGAGGAPRPSLDERGRGRHGVHFARGNLLEFGPFDGGRGEVALVGASYAGRVATAARPLSAPPFRREIDVGFRFHLSVEKE